MDLDDARVTVVGLGLIGGSLALGLQPRCRGLAGVDPDPKTIELARQAGIEVRELEPALLGADVLVLATPVRETLRLPFRAVVASSSATRAFSASTS